MPTKKKHDDRVNAISVANYLLDKGVKITPIQLVNLVYLCHAWHLAYGRGPLLLDQPQAWKYGPVVPSVYFAVRHFGNSPIKGNIYEGGAATPLTDSQTEVIDSVFEGYRDWDGLQLADLTHRSHTPWDKVWRKNGRNALIPDAVLRSHYAEKMHA